MLFKFSKHNSLTIIEPSVSLLLIIDIRFWLVVIYWNKLGDKLFSSYRSKHKVTLVIILTWIFLYFFFLLLCNKLPQNSTHLLPQSSLSFMSGHSSTEFSTQGLTKLKSVAGLCPHLESWLGKNLFSGSLTELHVDVGLRSQFSFWPLARVCSQLQQVNFILDTLPPPQHGKLFLQGQGTAAATLSLLKKSLPD